MREVVLSELAAADLTDIWVFVARDDVAAADRLIHRIYKRCHLLATRPKVGRMRPELQPSIRSSPVGSYLIFYRESPTGIEVASRAAWTSRHPGHFPFLNAHHP